jgi:uncharacterized protein (DUF1697 family)
MDALKKICQSVGVANVETFIASGNIIFDSASNDTEALETKLERALREALGYEVATFLRSTKALKSVAKYEPFSAAAVKNGRAVHVGFLKAKPPAAMVKALLAAQSDSDKFHVNGREAYWLLNVPFSESKFASAKLEKLIGLSTLRNVTTVRRMAERYC